jgi:hypothetical protein
MTLHLYHWRTGRSHNLNFTIRAPDTYICAFSTEELLYALENTPDTSPGLDAIHNQMLKNLPRSGMNFLLSVFNQISHEHQFPSLWHNATLFPYWNLEKTALLSPVTANFCDQLYLQTPWMYSESLPDVATWVWK